MKNCPHAEKYTPHGGRAIMQTMNEETIQAARAAWRRNPEDAAMAMLGITPEELFVEALRGCNQHKHKPGCPDANGGGPSSGEAQDEAWVDRWFKANANSGGELQYWQGSLNSALNKANRNDLSEGEYEKLACEVLEKGYKAKGKKAKTAIFQSIREREYQKAKTPEKKSNLDAFFKVMKNSVFNAW